MIKKWPKVQLAITLIVIGYFSTVGAGLAATYGSLVSLINTFLIDRHTDRQKGKTNISANASVGMMVMSVLMRMSVMAALIILGMMTLELVPEALIVGFVLGHIGFLIDRVRQNNGSK